MLIDTIIKIIIFSDSFVIYPFSFPALETKIRGKNGGHFRKLRIFAYQQDIFQRKCKNYSLTLNIMKVTGDLTYFVE